MANDRSVVCVVPVAQMDNANKLWREFDSIHAYAENFGVALVPVSGPDDAEATHYGSCEPMTEANAAVRSALPTNGGTLPPFTQHGTYMDWPDYGLTETEAKAAAASLYVSVVTGGSPQSHFAAAIVGYDPPLKIAVYPIEE
jgi:hypothetical protein